MLLTLKLFLIISSNIDDYLGKIILFDEIIHDLNNYNFLIKFFFKLCFDEY